MAEGRHSDAVARTANRRIAVLALFLATVVWYAIRAVIRFDAVVSDIPIEILHDEGLAVLDLSDEVVDIRFRGSRSDVRELTREQVRIVIDVRGKPTMGQQTARIEAANVHAPAAVRAISIQPDILTFSLDREGERQIPVRVEYQGTLPDGYEVEQTLCTPASVEIRGPMTRLEAADVVRTAPVDLDGRVQTFRARRPLVAPPGLEASRLDPDRVQIEVAILEHAANHTVDAVPVLLLTPPVGPMPVLLSPKQVSVVLQGRADVLKNMDAGEIRAYVDCSTLSSEDEMELPIRIHLMSGVRLASVTPSSARIQKFKATIRKDESL